MIMMTMMTVMMTMMMMMMLTMMMTIMTMTRMVAFVVDFVAEVSFVVAMPFDAKWVQLAKQVAAGTAFDDEVCSFKLKLSVLEKLPLDFVAAAYENAAHAYRSISGSSNTQRRQQVKSVYIAEKRKVLTILASTLKQKDNSADVAEGPMLQLAASASDSLSTPVPAPIVSAVVAQEAEEVSDNFLMVHSSGLVWTVDFFCFGMQ